MQTSDFDYELPPERIAQEPLAQRDAARMMVLERASGRRVHAHVRDLVDWLPAGDLLVRNDTRVFPARVFGRRADTGGRAELLLIEAVHVDSPTASRWTAFYRGTSRARPGMVLDLARKQLRAIMVSPCEDGRVTVDLETDRPLMSVLEQHGVAPVPPYIKRDPGGGDARAAMDRERYQTVYAREIGAVAAPTAGLHFTPELLERLTQAGVRHATITLHVGPGTFRPVKAERVEDHVMEDERFDVSPEAAAEIQETREAGGRIIAVGSTTVRTLETVAARHGQVVACRDRSNLFIKPPYAFQAVSGMLTNFHLPRSSLLMMVSALAGREFILDAYREAVQRRYRFYSYGDCMLIL